MRSSLFKIYIYPSPSTIPTPPSSYALFSICKRYFLQMKHYLNPYSLLFFLGATAVSVYVIYQCRYAQKRLTSANLSSDSQTAVQIWKNSIEIAYSCALASLPPVPLSLSLSSTTSTSAPSPPLDFPSSSPIHCRLSPPPTPTIGGARREDPKTNGDHSSSVSSLSLSSASCSCSVSPISTHNDSAGDSEEDSEKLAIFKEFEQMVSQWIPALSEAYRYVYPDTTWKEPKQPPSDWDELIRGFNLERFGCNGNSSQQEILKAIQQCAMQQGEKIPTYAQSFLNYYYQIYPWPMPTYYPRN